MKNLFLFLIFVFASVGFVSAQETSAFDFGSLKDKDLQAYQVLLKAEAFRLGAVGYAGITSDEELAFRVLLKSKKSVEAFEDLRNNASAEGKLYALLGLRRKNKVAYQQALSRLQLREKPPKRESSYGVFVFTERENGLVLENPDVRFVSEGDVVTQSGCVVSYKTWNEILGNIEAGEYDKFFKKH